MRLWGPDHYRGPGPFGTAPSSRTTAAHRLPSTSTYSWSQIIYICRQRNPAAILHLESEDPFTVAEAARVRGCIHSFAPAMGAMGDPIVGAEPSCGLTEVRAFSDGALEKRTTFDLIDRRRPRARAAGTRRPTRAAA